MLKTIKKSIDVLSEEPCPLRRGWAVNQLGSPRESSHTERKKRSDDDDKR